MGNGLDHVPDFTLTLLAPFLLSFCPSTYTRCSWFRDTAISLEMALTMTYCLFVGMRQSTTRHDSTLASFFWRFTMAQELELA